MTDYNVSIYVDDKKASTGYSHALTEGFPTLALAKRFAKASFAIGTHYPYKVIHSVKVFECTPDGGPEICHFGNTHTS